ncbi:MAG: MaoC/PaaZ C-terminal domain-containing protein [Myxococcota bacterium]
MPLSSRSVGATGEWVSTPIDARWTMAYAAGLGETSPEYTDTAARPDVLAHPLFPVCFEWPVFLGVADLVENEHLTPDERVCGVHFTHDLVLHQPIHAGQSLRTRARVVAVSRHHAGAYQVVEFETIDAAGLPVCTTWYGSLYRGIEVVGEDATTGDIPAEPVRIINPQVRRSVEVPVPAQAAHIYSECARIWNPIHTDTAVAARAGLPGIILHGTATLALAVSAIVDCELDGDGPRVLGIAARFGAMVAMPSTLTVQILRTDSDSIRFEVLNDRGEPAIRNGSVAISSSSRSRVGGPDR